ncbi:MAG: diguanylate cyclase, partial [Tardiphaga sp.]|nr:diguanylate cyclase [Tardiphaga sp.]
MRPGNRPKHPTRSATPKKRNAAATPASPRPLARSVPKLPVRRATTADVAEVARHRAETEAAIAQARRSHERLREAIDLLPQGIVFLDAEGRYILWNKKYAEIYDGTSDLFSQGTRLEDTIRVGVARGEYPEALGREEAWLAERLAKLSHPGERHEQVLADGRVILIEERLTDDGGVIGLRVDITELKQREASFRLLFDGNPVPMIVCAADGTRVLAVNDSAVAHYGYSRSDFERLSIGQLQA